MAVVTRKSTYIGNRDATPTVATGAAIAGGNVKTAEGFVTSANGDSATSFYPLVSVPSNARIRKVEYQCEAQGTSCTMNVGVFAPTSPPVSLTNLNAAYTSGAAINATFFASAIASASAVVPTDVTNQSGSNTLDKQEQELWQALGLASDPGCNLDIAVQVQVATAAAGRLGLKVDYVY